MNILHVIKRVRLMVGEREPYAFKNPFRVLITTVLSQRTRDENTRRAAVKLFSKYSTPKALSKAPVSRVEFLIKDSGFYRVKARRVKEIAQHVAVHGMPETFDELMKLPGVGRKTANCVLVYGYGVPAIPVDVHVHRISNRLGLVCTKSPEQTEMELMNLLPERYWLELNELLVKFGQRICKPVKPSCSECMLRIDCDYYKSL